MHGSLRIFCVCGFSVLVPGNSRRDNCFASIETRITDSHRIGIASRIHKLIVEVNIVELKLNISKLFLRKTKCWQVGGGFLNIREF